MIDNLIADQAAVKRGQPGPGNVGGFLQDSRCGAGQAGWYQANIEGLKGDHRKQTIAAMFGNTAGDFQRTAGDGKRDNL